MEMKKRIEDRVFFTASEYTTALFKSDQNEESKKNEEIIKNMSPATFWFHGQKIDYKAYKTPNLSYTHSFIVFRLVGNLLWAAGHVVFSGVILTTYHLGQAILLGIYKGVAFKDWDYFAAKRFSLLRDLEETAGYVAVAVGLVISSSLRKWGHFHIEQAQFKKEYYNFYLENRAANKKIILKIQSKLSEEKIDSVFGLIAQIKDKQTQIEQIQYVINQRGEEIDVSECLEFFSKHSPENCAELAQLFFLEGKLPEEKIKLGIDHFLENRIEKWKFPILVQMIAKVSNEEDRKNYFLKYLDIYRDVSNLTNYLKAAEEIKDEEIRKKCVLEAVIALYDYKENTKYLLLCATASTFLEPTLRNEWVIKVAQQLFKLNNNEEMYECLQNLTYDCNDFELLKFAVAKIDINNEIGNNHLESLLYSEKYNQTCALEVFKVYCKKIKLDSPLDDRKMLINAAKMCFREFKDEEKQKKQATEFMIEAVKIAYVGLGGKSEEVFFEDELEQKENDERLLKDVKESTNGRISLFSETFERLKDKDYTSLVNRCYEWAVGAINAEKLNCINIPKCIKDEKGLLIQIAKLNLKEDSKESYVMNFALEVIMLALITKNKKLEKDFGSNLNQAMKQQRVRLTKEGSGYTASDSFIKSMSKLVKEKNFKPMINFLWNQTEHVNEKGEFTIKGAQTLKY